MNRHKLSAADGLRELTFGKALRRGLMLKCPACGHGKLFQRMFWMHPKCEACSFSFERQPGYFLGSSYINYGVTASAITVSYVSLHFGLGVSNQMILPGLLSFCGIFPLVFFRFARSLWLSFDCLFDRMGALEAAASQSEIEAANGIQK